jgi:hypothetical protein
LQLNLGRGRCKDRGICGPRNFGLTDPVTAKSASFCPDPDLYHFQINVKIDYTFSRKFQNTMQNTGNYDTYDTDETGTAGKKCKLFFQHV